MTTFNRYSKTLIAKERRNRESISLADDVKRYLELLEKQSPIVSTSHLLLGDIYKIWGRDKVRLEIERQLKESK